LSPFASSVSDDRGHFAPMRIVGGHLPVTATPGAVTLRWPQGIEFEIAVEQEGSGIERLARELVAPCLR